MTALQQTMHRPDRRRFLQVCAVAAAGFAIGVGPAAGTPILRRWKGVALGAPAEIRLLCTDGGTARSLFRSVEAEVRRLEAIFSLYKPDSELVRLNQDGRLMAPSLEFLELLGIVRNVHALTDGAFDPTVQPLWRSYADPQSTVAARQAAAELVDFGKVVVDTDRVVFAASGMAMTLNGIAQGYITDRVAALLRARGCSDVVVNLGEVSASGTPRSEGQQGWPVILRPDSALDAAREKVSLSNQAVASSARLGTTFDIDGRRSHIIDPRNGTPVEAGLRGASVIASTAALADGLSTAALVCGETRLAGAILKLDQARAFLVRDDGSTGWLES